jgi:thioredoxin-dependent peroxiredoxin
MPLIDAGQPAPDFSLRDQEGKPHALKDFAGRPLVLYFYPKDDTAVCTTEACEFRDHNADFGEIKAAVVGVSPDDQASHQAFAQKYKLEFPLLSDTDLDAQGHPKVAEAYGAFGEKTMYGRTTQGVIRTTYLIDAQGKVAERWDNVRVRGHVEDVLEALSALERGELKDGEPVAGADVPGKPRQQTRAARMDPKFTPVRGGQGPNSAAQAPPRAGAGRAQKGK